MHRKRVFLNIGQYYVTDQPNIISIVGLGSCVGVFLFDKYLRIGGGVHIALPERKGNKFGFGKGAYADFAINNQLVLFKKLGSPLKHIKAVVIGGAEVIKHARFEIGNSNILAVKHQMLEKGIFMAYENVGGHESRSINFLTDTGGFQIIKGGRIIKNYRYEQECIDSR